MKLVLEDCGTHTLFAFQSLILIDGEGTPLQELAALEVDKTTHEILNVFHGFARVATDSDNYARKHVHGLCRHCLNVRGCDTEAGLVAAFKSWLTLRPYGALYANGADREAILLDMPVCVS